MAEPSFEKPIAVTLLFVTVTLPATSVGSLRVKLVYMLARRHTSQVRPMKSPAPALPRSSSRRARTAPRDPFSLELDRHLLLVYGSFSCLFVLNKLTIRTLSVSLISAWLVICASPSSSVKSFQTSGCPQCTCRESSKDPVTSFTPVRMHMYVVGQSDRAESGAGNAWRQHTCHEDHALAGISTVLHVHCRDVSRNCRTVCQPFVWLLFCYAHRLPHGTPQSHLWAHVCTSER